MKFSCDRCGKRYAAAARPEPGRVYKVRCRACGHLVAVRAPAAAPEPVAAAAESASRSAAPSPTPPPGETSFVDLFADLPDLDALVPPDPAEEAAFFADPRRKTGPIGPGSGSLPLGAPGEGQPERTPGRGARTPGGIKMPIIPKPKPQRSNLPLVLLAIGIVLVLGIVGFVAVSPRARAPEAPPAAPPARLP